MSQGNGSSGSLGTTQQVVDFSEARAQKLEEKRKNTERIFFKKVVFTQIGREAIKSKCRFLSIKQCTNI